ncbi:hypothetical protein LXL04_009513 [Taraxacum kok-saghyz]
MVAYWSTIDYANSEQHIMTLKPKITCSNWLAFIQILHYQLYNEHNKSKKEVKLLGGVQGKKKTMTMQIRLRL